MLSLIIPGKENIQESQKEIFTRNPLVEELLSQELYIKNLYFSHEQSLLIKIVI